MNAFPFVSFFCLFCYRFEVIYSHSCFLLASCSFCCAVTWISVYVCWYISKCCSYFVISCTPPTALAWDSILLLRAAHGPLRGCRAWRHAPLCLFDVVPWFALVVTFRRCSALRSGVVVLYCICFICQLTFHVIYTYFLWLFTPYHFVMYSLPPSFIDIDVLFELNFLAVH